MAVAQLLTDSHDLLAAVHDGDAKTIQKEKEKAMKGEKSDQGTPGWNETIASESEAKVKAQKNPKGPEELQAETAKIKESEHVSLVPQFTFTPEPS